MRIVGPKDIIYHDLRTDAASTGATASHQEVSWESSCVAKGHGIYIVPSFADPVECDELMAVAAEHARVTPVAPEDADDAASGESTTAPPPRWRLGFDDAQEAKKMPFWGIGARRL
eukprot:4153624-Prymnesium_polylepis.1